MLSEPVSQGAVITAQDCMMHHTRQISAAGWLCTNRYSSHIAIHICIDIGKLNCALFHFIIVNIWLGLWHTCLIYPQPFYLLPPQLKIWCLNCIVALVLNLIPAFYLLGSLSYKRQLVIALPKATPVTHQRIQHSERTSWFRIPCKLQTQFKVSLPLFIPLIYSWVLLCVLFCICKLR